MFRSLLLVSISLIFFLAFELYTNDPKDDIITDRSWCDSKAALKLRNNPPLTNNKYLTVNWLYQNASQGETIIFAHRGGMACQELDAAPENSLANVEKAVRMGFTGVEADLFRTLDGQFVIHHDSWLGRTTFPPKEVIEKEDDAQKVENTTFAEIRNLRLKYPSGRVSTEKVPSLTELLDTGRGRILFLIELKGRSVFHFPDIIKVVEEANALKQVLFRLRWSPKIAEVFDDNVKKGLKYDLKSIVWRVESQLEYEDVVRKFKPRLIDIMPSWNELRMEYYLKILPQEHLTRVDNALKEEPLVMVSRIYTNTYFLTLHDKGVRVFMSRTPEQHISLLNEQLHTP